MKCPVILQLKILCELRQQVTFEEYSTAVQARDWAATSLLSKWVFVKAVCINRPLNPI